MSVINLDDIKSEYFKESTLDDNQKYNAIRMCILHVFGKHSDNLDKYGLEICDYRALLKFLSVLYKSFYDRKVEVQK